MIYFLLVVLAGLILAAFLIGCAHRYVVPYRQEDGKVVMVCIACKKRIT